MKAKFSPVFQMPSPAHRIQIHLPSLIYPDLQETQPLKTRASTSLLCLLPKTHVLEQFHCAVQEGSAQWEGSGLWGTTSWGLSLKNGSVITELSLLFPLPKMPAYSSAFQQELKQHKALTTCDPDIQHPSSNTVSPKALSLYTIQSRVFCYSAGKQAPDPH